MQVTVSPGAFNDIVVPPLKLAGVITTAFEPLVDTFMIVLIWPFAPSANVHGACAEVAFTSVTALVTSIAVDVEPSPLQLLISHHFRFLTYLTIYQFVVLLH